MLYTKNGPAASNRRLILILISITSALSIALPPSSMPVLFKEIAQELNLNPLQIGSIWGIISFGSIFITPLGGILCDKVGTKRMLILAGILTGLTGALRGLSTGSASLIATTFLCGAASALLMPAVVLGASQAAGRGNQGVGQSWVSVGGGTGMVLGSMVSATWASPLLGGWRHVLLVYGGLSILGSLLWLLVAKWPESEKATVHQERASFARSFVQVFQNKAFWMIGLTILAYQGCVVGMQGFLPYYLENQGWTTAAASGTIAIYSATSIVGVVPLTILSDRLKSRKLFLYASFIFAFIGVGLMSVIHNGALWILVVIVGIFAQMNSALAVAMSLEGSQVKAATAGMALGVVLSIGLIGRTFAPPIGNSLANSSAIGWPFLFWAGLALVGLLIMLFVKESRRTASVARPELVIE